MQTYVTVNHKNEQKLFVKTHKQTFYIPTNKSFTLAELKDLVWKMYNIGYDEARERVQRGLKDILLQESEG